MIETWSLFPTGISVATSNFTRHLNRTLSWLKNWKMIAQSRISQICSKIWWRLDFLSKIILRSSSDVWDFTLLKPIETLCWQLKIRLLTTYFALDSSFIENLITWNHIRISAQCHWYLRAYQLLKSKYVVSLQKRYFSFLTASETSNIKYYAISCIFYSKSTHKNTL